MSNTRSCRACGGRFGALSRLEREHGVHEFCRSVAQRPSEKKERKNNGNR